MISSCPVDPGFGSVQIPRDSAPVSIFPHLVSNGADIAGSASDATVGPPPFEVLVLPYALDEFPQMTYAVLRSRDGDEHGWHGLAGFGRHGEEPIEAARRHAWQHAGVPEDAAFLALQVAVPTPAAPSDDDRQVQEYAFAALVDPAELRVPDEHELCWVAYDVAHRLLQRDPERSALWELRRRIAARS